MSECGLIPLYDQLVIQAIEEKLSKVILTPERSTPKPTKGLVLAAGEGKLLTATGAIHPMKVKVGDVVAFSHYSGGEVEVGGKKYLVAKEDQVYVIIKDQKERESLLGMLNNK